jgi:hypothetical protein
MGAAWRPVSKFVTYIQWCNRRFRSSTLAEEVAPMVGGPPGLYRRTSARSVPLGILPSPPGVLGKYSLFKGLAAWIYRKHFVLRYLEPKYLKKKNLCGSVHETARTRWHDLVCAQYTPLNQMLANSEKQSAKEVVA